MKTISLVATGTALSLMSAWGCNKETTQTATTTSQVAPAPPAASIQPNAATPGQAGAAMNGQMTDQMRASCPMVVSGADVEVKDTDTGVALSFSTIKGDAADLRARVDRMAQMYEMHSGHGAMSWHSMMAYQGGPGAGHMGSGNGMGSSNGMGSGNGMMGRTGNGMGMGIGIGTGQMGDGAPMPAAKATVEPTSQGARLMLTPTDPSQLEALRTQVRNHQERMHSGQCWMLNQQSPASGPGQ